MKKLIRYLKKHSWEIFMGGVAISLFVAILLVSPK